MKKYFLIPALIAIGTFAYVQSGATRPASARDTAVQSQIRQDTVPRTDTSWHKKGKKSKMKKDTSSWPRDTVPH